MQFASPLPWWLTVLVAAGIAAVSYAAYRRPRAPLSAPQRWSLTALRALALAAVVFFLCRPVRLVTPPAIGEGVVPVLIDVSRSMRVADAGGQSRFSRAIDLLQNDLLPALTTPYSVELYAVGEGLVPASVDRLAADGRQSDLSGAIAAMRAQSRGRGVPGIIVVSDGGDTGSPVEDDDSGSGGPRVFTVGIGSPEGPRDREVLSVVAGDPRLDDASVDLHVSAVSHGFGREPFQVRVLANGQLIDSRRVVPTGDGAPVDEMFTVSPDPVNPTVFAAEIAADPGEPVVENNTRAVVVSPPGRKRRILLLQGAPGHEHSFLVRALARDEGLEVDSVVRKGRSDEGDDTFFVQASGRRQATLASGFPASREALYAYDALVIANIEGDFFTRAQLAMAADFVAVRGGGLLVLGGRSLAQRGLAGTALEEALPVELNDRRGGLSAGAYGVDPPESHNTVRVTAEGARHPVMRLNSPAAESGKLWAALPALLSSAPLGAPRRGATVLAVTRAPSGAVYPLVAVQRYGRGRSMVFAGEGAWRWRMLRPSADLTYEYFWRQALRWLAGPAPEPVTLAMPSSAEPGDSVEVAVDARDAAYASAANAVVDATIAEPGGKLHQLALRDDARTPGRHAGSFRPEQAGLYRVRGEARRGAALLGSAEGWFYVGGYDREFAEPRLNEGVLQRLAEATGGEYVRPADVGRIVELLRRAEPPDAIPERRDAWHGAWALLLLAGLLSTEWILRRRWGLR
jgi:uncharacterized membrane protein